jgi:hypothetical protein
MKVPQDIAQDFKTDSWEFQRYENSFNEAVIRPLDKKNPKVAELEPLFIAAYNHVTGIK